VDIPSEAVSQGWTTSVTEEIGSIPPPALRDFNSEESSRLSLCVSDTLYSNNSFQDVSWSGILPATTEGSDYLNTLTCNWDSSFPLTHGSNYGFPLIGNSIDVRVRKHDSDPGDDFEIRCHASRRLATLSVVLYESVMPFPTLEKIRLAAEKATAVENKTRKTIKLVFDELFNHTNDFTHVIQSLSSSPGQEGQATTYPDEALVSLIFSCHCQLAEAYTSLLNMIRACLEHSMAPPANTNWAVVLPKLQVGSVALPSLQVDNKNPVSSRATSRMYMASITTVTALLWTQMMSAVKAVAASQENTSSIYGSTVAVMWDAMSRRTDEMVHRIELLSSIL
jgi:hypothetical protein